MLKHPATKPLVFILCLLPVLALVYQAFLGDLGANPVETITHETGEWTLRFLLLTLAITPLRQWSANRGWMLYRRMLGLFVYFYACLHLMIWLIADHVMDLALILEDIVERPYVTLGFAGFVLLTPLAMTSNRWSMRKLGKRWQLLHRLVYPSLILGIGHYLWLVKADYLEAGIYAAIGFILLLSRLKFAGWLKQSVASS